MGYRRRLPCYLRFRRDDDLYNMVYVDVGMGPRTTSLGLGYDCAPRSSLSPLGCVPRKTWLAPTWALAVAGKPMLDQSLRQVEVGSIRLILFGLSVSSPQAIDEVGEFGGMGFGVYPACWLLCLSSYCTMAFGDRWLTAWVEADEEGEDTSGSKYLSVYSNYQIIPMVSFNSCDVVDSLCRWICSEGYRFALRFQVCVTLISDS